MFWGFSSTLFRSSIFYFPCLQTPEAFLSTSVSTFECVFKVASASVIIFHEGSQTEACISHSNDVISNSNSQMSANLSLLRLVESRALACWEFPSVGPQLSPGVAYKECDGSVVWLHLIYSCYDTL